MDHGAAKLTGLDLVFNAHHRRTFVRIEESRGGSKRQPCLANIAVRFHRLAHRIDHHPLSHERLLPARRLSSPSNLDGVDPGLPPRGHGWPTFARAPDRTHVGHESGSRRWCVFRRMARHARHPAVIGFAPSPPDAPSMGYGSFPGPYTVEQYRSPYVMPDEVASVQGDLEDDIEFSVYITLPNLPRTCPSAACRWPFCSTDLAIRMLMHIRIGSTTSLPKAWPWRSSSTRLTFARRAMKHTKPPTNKACRLSPTRSARPRHPSRH